MARPAPQAFGDVEACVDAVIARVGREVRIGLPLGLGKPVELVNALYARAKREPDLKLTILTALSLDKPRPEDPIERAFMQPIIDRIFEGVPQLDYAFDLSRGALPANVRICEFFFRPGSQLGNTHSQRNYISTNYTFAARDVFAQGCNVCAQMVCRRETPHGTRYSLSCNPDTGPELIELMRASGEPHAVVGLVNQSLPYMAHDAEVEPGLFDFVVDAPRYTTPLFPTPKTAVTTPDYAIGLYASALIRDGGTLQIGIGALGDAVVYAAQLRHGRNEAYRAALKSLGALARHRELIENFGGVAPFEHGLYGATEMFVDGFLHLYRAGILKRKVYDFWALQQLINDGRCDPNALDAGVLEGLESLGVRTIRTRDFTILQHHGFFNDATRYDLGHIIAPSGERVIANVAEPHSRKVIARECLGRELRNGIVLHGGFFLGPRGFYDALCAMDEDERRLFCMTGVYKINQLDHNPRLYKAQRRHARFINTGIMVTLSGAVMSDGLDDGRIISGVGGQYNFVAMAHQLLTGRSILMIRAVRDREDGTPSSNVVFNYGHITIPRHLRDIVITEYGIADLRGRTDNEVIKALLNVADSRFQPELLDRAKRSGKLESDYTIPEAFRRNTPQQLEAKLADCRRHKLFPAFPFGTDLTETEVRLGRALRAVKARAATTPKWGLLLKGLGAAPGNVAQAELERLGIARPNNLRERVLRALLIEELRGDAPSARAGNGE
jgi:acyl-CoA hydrolase